ncbi:sure-like protein [Rhodocollybia butyracea]|uniref:Sure-like protein n=1 Tax=Rhodocollybia butyracea TaxID=206335 RepID=A0A9P5Q3Y6_9AGAR|nr:sure-like protein [Rhodocollybia butyracea]
MKFSTSVAFLFVGLARSTNVVLTNDDGWAVAMIRAQNTALLNAGYDVVLSSPAQDESGTGTSTAPPTVLTEPCEFNTCPTGSPPEGFNASDPRLNYVNSFPVDAVSFGIQTLAPQFFGGPPDFVVSGPNVGNNIGPGVIGSGTVGAACEAALLGVPSVAFSAEGVSQVAYTDLANNDTDTVTAEIAAALTVKFLDALLADGKPYLPSGVSLNVNFPNCSSPSEVKFLFTRLAFNLSATDVETCGTDHLPSEIEVAAIDLLTSGCFATVSVMNATTITDVDATTQAFVLNRLPGFFSCLL